ncbi:unnamed protein product [Fusarium graminearum]|uniref:Chromosome 1, complete genome n=1 Tax=Gibberella zeae (strain ATCC MYA-4620 / CBS 123657 / FGSC 9075 / NRRL 31084 / PH-1) TaxID=229533 RepID=A0A0E0RQE5_GIBZE|nr:hypothetical protein FG05_35025 [Fusarium graminearum]CEF73470.1 unnamed protein product [Fusarium graminearum]
MAVMRCVQCQWYHKNNESKLLYGFNEGRLVDA